MKDSDRMADGYPSKLAEADFAIHQEINSHLLRRAEWRWRQVLPAAWLTPALQRLDWHLRENSEGELHAPSFVWIIEDIIHPMQSVSEEQFFFICEWSAPRYLGGQYCTSVPKIAQFGKHLHETQGLSPVSVNQFWKVIRAFHGLGEVLIPLQPLAMKLFRAEAKNVSACEWLAATAASIFAMPKPGQVLWRKLLDINDYRLVHTEALPKSAAQLLDQIDPNEFVETFARWTRALADVRPLHLRDTSSMQLTWLLRICDTLPSLDLDESLYRLAGAEWDRQHFYWLNTYLKVLLGRPPAKAFACVEALAMNPATGSVQAVRDTYETLLRNCADIQSVSGLDKGIDGFVMDASQEYALEHRLIDQCLRATAAAVENTRTLIVRQASPESGGHNRLVLALDKRVYWITLESPAPKEQRELWRWNSGTLLAQLLLEVKDPPGDVLLAALNAICTGRLLRVPLPLMFSLCKDYVEKHGWHMKFVAAMQRWVKTMHGSLHGLFMRRQIEWFLMSEDVSPIKTSDCWGNLVRFDLRNMPPAERLLWIEILGNGTTFVGAIPPLKWLKPAKVAYAKVSRESFRLHFRHWFQHFRAADPLKLTSAGGDLLRILIWYALVAEDPEVDEAVAWLAQVKWKNKISAGKTNKSEAAFVYMLTTRNSALAYATFEKMLETGSAAMGGRIHEAYQKLCERFDKKPVVPVKAGPKHDPLEELRTKVLNRFATNMKVSFLDMLSRDAIDEIGQPAVMAFWEEETLVIATGGETYRLSDVGHKITRDSDGATLRVEVPWDLPKYGSYRSTIEGPTMLKEDLSAWMRLGVYALVIVDDPWSIRVLGPPN